MKSAISKRSVVINGRKTSVSLEEPFWAGVRDIAGAQEMTVSSLLRQIDLDRRDTNLSSAIRVYVLQHITLIRTTTAANATTPLTARPNFAAL